MSEPTVTTRSRDRHGLRRVVDLLAIVAVAFGLLFVAWRQVHVPHATKSPTARGAPPPAVVGLPSNFQPLFVRNEMYMTNWFAPGTREAAIASLQRACSDVLKDSRGKILPLEVNAAETEMLGQCRESARITSASANPDTAIYALPIQAGLIGVRFHDSYRLSPTNTSAPNAALGHRVICYGYVTSQGTSGHTIWFFRHR